MEMIYFMFGLFVLLLLFGIHGYLEKINDKLEDKVGDLGEVEDYLFKINGKLDDIEVHLAFLEDVEVDKGAKKE